MFKSTQVAVNADHPFANDKLNRKPTADSLSTLIATFTDPMVLSIDASWGAGKTTFIKMWAADLGHQKDRFECVYFNAWENDFVADPLIPFVAEFDRHFRKRLQHEKRDKMLAQLSKVTNTAGRLIEAAARPALKFVTGGSVDIAELSFKSESAQRTLEIVGETVERPFREYEERRKAVHEFHTSIEQFLGELHPSKTTPSVVFFIDELDRCRPTFSIELLETIKHLFNIPGIIFVLALDTIQLSHSIKAVYGQDFDAIGYLRRFIDLQFRLPDPPTKQYIQYLLDVYGFEDIRTAKGYDHTFQMGLMEWLEPISSQFGFSLRDIERCMRDLSLALRLFAPESLTREPGLRSVYLGQIVFMAMLRVKDHDLYRDLRDMRAPTERIIELLTARRAGIPLDSYRQHMIEVIVEHCASTRDQLEALVESDRTTVKDQSLAKEVSERLWERIRYFEWAKWNPHNALFEAVEFAGSFSALTSSNTQ